MKDPQSFCGSEICCGLLSTAAHVIQQNIPQTGSMVK